MTHYLLSVHGPAERNEYGNYGSKEAMEEAFAATGAFNDQLRADGYWVFAGGLQPASTATVVDGQGATPVMTDGPYLETKSSSEVSGSSTHPTSTWRSRLPPRGREPVAARSRSVRSTVRSTDRWTTVGRPSSGSSARSTAA
jgi:hypothetical protein